MDTQKRRSTITCCIRDVHGVPFQNSIFEEDSVGCYDKRPHMFPETNGKVCSLLPIKNACLFSIRSRSSGSSNLRIDFLEKTSPY